jgi:hypothetical protein
MTNDEDKLEFSNDEHAIKGLSLRIWISSFLRPSSFDIRHLYDVRSVVGFRRADTLGQRHS